MRLSHAVLIRRPIQEVFEFVSEPGNLRLWTGGVSRVDRISAGPVEVGTRFATLDGVTGWRPRTHWEVVAWEPPGCVAYRALEGSDRTEVWYRLERCEGGTRLLVQADVEAEGLFAPPAPLLEGVARRQLETDLACLRALLERPSDDAREVEAVGASGGGIFEVAGPAAPGGPDRKRHWQA